MHPVFLFLHVAGVILWVGGMFFAWWCLRPIAAEQLDAPTRLRLWAGVFARFFPWVSGSIAAILLSGLVTLLRVGMDRAPPHWHVMTGLGLTMMAIYAYVYFLPYATLRNAVAAGAWPVGGAALGRIRQLVGTNLLLGSLTVVVATLGRLAA